MKTIVQCRMNYTIELPCNYIKDGICGVDGKACKLLGVVGYK